VTRALAEIGMERGTGRSQARSSAGNAGDLMGRRWWRGCRLVREAGPTLMAVVALLAALTASGHEDPQMIPDGSDPVVRWYQPPGTPLVADWDVEMTSLEPGAMPSIFPAEAVPDESCWALHVDTEEPVRVRVRAFQNGVVSAWSDYTLVPEPGLATALGVAVPALMIAARRRPRSSFERHHSGSPEPPPTAADLAA